MHGLVHSDAKIGLGKFVLSLFPVCLVSGVFNGATTLYVCNVCEILFKELCV